MIELLNENIFRVPAFIPSQVIKDPDWSWQTSWWCTSAAQELNQGLYLEQIHLVIRAGLVLKSGAQTFSHPVYEFTTGTHDSGKLYWLQRPHLHQITLLDQGLLLILQSSDALISSFPSNFQFWHFGSEFLNDGIISKLVTLFCKHFWQLQ